MPLILGSFAVTFLARELDALLRGNEIRSVYISDDRVLSFSLREKAGSASALRFLHAPGFSLLCMDRRAGSDAGFTHLPRFENLIRGLSIAEVRQVDLDRIVKVVLGAHGASELNLYFELNPSLPNLFLTDAAGIILAMLLRAGTRTRTRRLDGGRRYIPPPAPCKIGPSEVDEKYLGTLDWWQDDRVLSHSVVGVGPFLSREVAQRARGYGSYFKAYDELMSAYRRGDSKPHVFSVPQQSHNRPSSIGVTWYRPEQKGAAEIRSAPTMNDAALEILKSLTVSRAFDRRRDRVMKTIAREARKWRKVEAETRDAASEAEAAATYRKYGELIMASLDNIRKGAREVMLSDLHSGGRKSVSVVLQPHLTPQANAQAYFKKARKSARRAGLAQQKLETARRRLSALNEVSLELQSLNDPRRLTEIEERVLFVVPDGGTDKPAEDERALRLGIRPRRYSIVGGWTVFVGRSAKENDVLTHRYAAPGDIWFHARQAQGAHVVLRRGKGRAQPAKQAIEEAAAIAAYYSKARTSTQVPVSYTEKRYVKKVRKAPPGTAAMLREKVIFVDPRLPRGHNT